MASAKHDSYGDRHSFERQQLHLQTSEKLLKHHDKPKQTFKKATNVHLDCLCTVS